MNIGSLFEKRIDRTIQGVVTIGNEDEDQKWQELEEYVCTNEIVKSFRSFFRRYREAMNTPTDKIGVWITGFFGSGKSHFLKILGYILENQVVAGWEAVKYFDDKIKDELILADMRHCAKANNLVVLFNIASRAKPEMKNRADAILDAMLCSFNEAIGYCGSQPWVAELERTLDNENILQQFIEKFEEYSGREWKKSRAKALLNKDYIVRALVDVRRITEESAKEFIDDQIKNYSASVKDFAVMVRDYCNKTKSRVIFLMDEVGQFIGDNTQMMVNLQSCVEELGKHCRGQAWVVITSQQMLKAMIEGTKEKREDLSKIQARFDLHIVLSGANADEVVRKRLLDKKENAITPLESLYEANSSKLSNLIMFPGRPTWSGFKDAEEFREVYPFLPYQFGLLQKVFTAIREHGMSEGKSITDTERSLLSAFQSAARRIVDEEAGILVPFDSFFDTVDEVADYDIKTVFARAEKLATIDSFAMRVLRVLFMIKYINEMPATIDRLATLLVSSIYEDKAVLKENILTALKDLEAEMFIQKRGNLEAEEYDFLTNEEQGVNRQINNMNWNEGEVQRGIWSLVYERVLELSKYRYERYEFGLNRYVDGEIKGNPNADFLTIKIYTNYSGNLDSVALLAESARTNALIIDMREGAYADELIRVSKIDAFKRNNSAVMSPSMADIMSKKMAERSNRLTRAEDMIKVVLRSAPMYYNGQQLDIKEKDPRERVSDALRLVVRQDFYKIGLVAFYYNDPKAVMQALDEDPSESLLLGTEQDSNKGAYTEIVERIKSDRQLGRNITVKYLLEVFGKRPYGWRDIDVLGMLATLWRAHTVQFFLHEKAIEETNRVFKNDFARKSGIDAVVVRIQEKIDDDILYQVKRIMNDAYAENIPLDEAKLKEGVVSFFQRKKEFLSGLRTQYGADYAGCRVVPDLYRSFDAITRSSDTLTIFTEVINRKDELIGSAEVLEQLESFYHEGSSQQKTYQDACKIVDWYRNNYMFGDLGRLEDVISRIGEIIALELPFSRMSELSSLVFQAKEVRDAIFDEKFQATKTRLENDESTINREKDEALASDLSEEQKAKITEKAQEIFGTYATWFEKLSKTTPNLDSYVTSSETLVKRFREFIAAVMTESARKVARAKRVRIIDCVPIANKKIASQNDIEKVVAAIRDRLVSELKDTDEITLD